ncbi:MAG: serine hydrolase domain-containing protein [Solirubrobacteraceae bacterium]
MGSQGHEQDDLDLDALARFRALRPLLRSPGVSAGALLPGGRRWTAADGMADVEAAVPVTAATPMRIGSITKTFTASAIALLAERGALDLDDPAVLHLPDLRGLSTNGHSLRAVTVRRLLLHRSGLVGEPPTRNWLRSPFPGISEILQRIDLAQIAIAPGSAFKYSNLGYALLGEIVSRASNDSYERFVQKQLLDPAGLTSTTFEMPATAALGYGGSSAAGWVRQKTMEFGGERSAGGMWSTVSDLLRWAEVAMGEVPDVLSPETAALLRDPDAGRNVDSAPANALGWQLRRSEGHLLCEHGGGTTGYTCHLAFEPSQRTTAVVLTNGHAQPEIACLGLLGVRCPARSTFLPASLPPISPSSPDPVGDYLGPLDFAASIERRTDGELWLTGELLHEPMGARLQPQADDRYLVGAGRFAGEMLTFDRHDDEKIVAFTVAGFRHARG